MADEQDRPKLLEQFTNITGASEERAKFFLESAAWNCDIAIANFYEDGVEILSSDEDDEAKIPKFPPSQPLPPLPQQQHHTFGFAKKTPEKSSNSKISTLNTLKQIDTSSSEEEGQAFYAGGSESGGGQQILGPKKKKDKNELVSDMFKMAKEHGAEVVENPSGPATSNKRPVFFQGQAYRLGGEDDANKPSTSLNTSASASTSAPHQTDVVLKFWQDGFSVDNGPLRDFNDPGNMEFLKDIKNGKVPKELIALVKGGQINLNMEDHSSEDYVKPKVTMQAFTGHGYRLGNPTDGTPVTPKVSAEETRTEARNDLNKKATDNINLDNTKPVTNLQIRLPDGTRLVAKFNHSHTVGDVRNYLVSSHPHLSSRPFVLMTTFPNKELNEDDATLSSANLINSLLVLKYK